MASVLISGGLGQMGMGIAQHAVKAGWSVTLLGRSSLKTKPAIYQDILEEWATPYIPMDVYSERRQEDLKKLASGHQYWIHAAEPYRYRDIRQLELDTDLVRIYKVAAQAGYKLDNPEKKKFVRIGSPPAEVYESRFFKKSFGEATGFPEDCELSRAYASGLAFSTPYFKMKRILREAAKIAFEQHKVAVVTALPTGLIGPFGNHGKDYEIMVMAIKGVFPFKLLLPGGIANVVALADAAKGVLQVAREGKPGENYQLAGVDLPFYEPVRMAIAAAPEAGNYPPPSRIVEVPSYSLAILSAKAVTYMAGLFKSTPPWFFNEDFFALSSMMGSRTATKAVMQLGYQPSSTAAIQKAVEKAVDWYRGVGFL